MSIYKKLLKIQENVKGLSKDKKSHNYDYVTGNKLLSFIKPLMDENQLILKQEVLSIENTRQDYQVWDKWAENAKGTKGDWKPKNEILSKVMMKFTWVDCETGEKDENLFGANGQNDWEKGLGSALTYAERYFLLKYFHIATDEDDIDNPNRKELQQKTITKDKRVLLGEILAAKDIGQLQEIYNANIEIKTDKELIAAINDRKKQLIA